MRKSLIPLHFGLLISKMGRRNSKMCFGDELKKIQIRLIPVNGCYRTNSLLSDYAHPQNHQGPAQQRHKYEPEEIGVFIPPHRENSRTRTHTRPLGDRCWNRARAAETFDSRFGILVKSVTRFYFYLSFLQSLAAMSHPHINKAPLYLHQGD